MGRIKIPLKQTQQWQATKKQLSLALIRGLNMRCNPTKTKTRDIVKLGIFREAKQPCAIELNFNVPISLIIAGHTVPLAEVASISSNGLAIASDSLIPWANNPAAKTRSNYQSSQVRREAQKLDTQSSHQSWQKEYALLKRKYPDKSKTWCAIQIAKMDISRGRKTGTIRRILKS